MSVLRWDMDYGFIHMSENGRFVQYESYEILSDAFSAVKEECELLKRLLERAEVRNDAKRFSRCP